MGAKAEGVVESQMPAVRRTPGLYLLISLPSSRALQSCSGAWQGDKHPGKQQLHLSLIFQLTSVMHPAKENSEISSTLLTDTVSPNSVPFNRLFLCYITKVSIILQTA